MSMLRHSIKSGIALALLAAGSCVFTRECPVPRLSPGGHPAAAKA
jgi:hypothetical protein